MNDVKSFSNIVDLDSWEKLQNAISEVTGMAIHTVDYRGIPITTHSGCSEFCSHVRSEEKLSNLCQKCDARGSLEGVLKKRPYIYQCHFGIVDIAIPIIVEDSYLGAVMAGQVHVKGESEEELEQILTIDSYETEAIIDKYRKCYNKIPSYTKEQLDHMTKMLFHLCSFFATEILKKGNNDSANIDIEKKLLIGEQSFYYPNLSNQIIMKAINYMYSEKEKMITLTEAADFCHVSAPYFSKLFAKEIGEPFTTFITKLKISWAKDFLKGSDMTVSEVSIKLGFSEPGYFIKIFKKITGETPMGYRNRCKNYGVDGTIQIARVK